MVFQKLALHQLNVWLLNVDTLVTPKLKKHILPRENAESVGFDVWSSFISCEKPL